MASAQAIAMSEQEKQNVAAMVEQSKSIGKCNLQNAGANANDQAQNSAVVTMNNSTTSLINFNQSFDWAGSIIGGSYPQSIFSANSGTFTHAGQPNNGSQGAVLYFGNNKQGAPCGWLLAWAAPTYPNASTPNRVYVECGPKSNYGTINWGTIKSKLDVSNSYSNYFDPATQTNIAAQLTPSGSFAALGANFGVI